MLNKQSDSAVAYQNTQAMRSRVCSPTSMDEETSGLDTDSMSCYVSLPDGLILEVILPKNAKGIDCLAETCKRLDIVEADYFGLRYEGAKGEMLWLNLRNRISKQLRQSRWKTVARHQSYRCYRLQFRVKFFVPVHMLLQDTTRMQFYRNMRNSFLDGDLVRYAQTGALSRSDLIGLYALIAQVELGDYDSNRASITRQQYHEQLAFRPKLNLLTKIEDDSRLQLPSSSSSSSSGLIIKISDDEDAVFDAICQAHSSMTGMKRTSALYKFIETLSKLDDYGYEYHLVENSRYEHMVIGVGPDAVRVCKLNSTILGNASLCVARSGSSQIDSVRVCRVRRDSDSDSATKPEQITSLLRIGSASRRTLFRLTTTSSTPIGSTEIESDPELSFRASNNSRNSSERSDSSSGSESESHAACKFDGGLLKKALREMNAQRLVGECVERFPYAIVSRARMDDRVLFLTVVNEHGDEREFGSRCASSKAAIALYRAITERHTFYRCDSIRDDVASQTKRAFRSPLASLFSEVAGSADRTDFIFDVTRTSREAFDRAKRTLFRRDCERASATRRSLSSPIESDSEVFEAADVEPNAKLGGANASQQASLLEEVNKLREQLRVHIDDQLCRLCMDAPKQVAFEPCGHFCACQSCAVAVNQCPFCRANISKVIRIYEATSS